MKTIALVLVMSLFETPKTPETNIYRNQSTTRIQPTKNNMEQQTEQIVRNFLTAVQTGDHPTAIALVHPNVVWNQPGNNRFSGRKISRNEVVQMIGGMTAVSAKSLRLSQFDRMSVNGEPAACVVHWQAVQEAGGRLDVDNIDVYTVKNGQIVEATIYSADIRQEDDFWGK